MKKWTVRLRYAGQVIVGEIIASSAKEVKQIISQRQDCQLIEISVAKNKRR